MSLKVVSSFTILYTLVPLALSFSPNIEKDLGNKSTVLKYVPDFGCTEGMRKRLKRGIFLIHNLSQMWLSDKMQDTQLNLNFR